MKILDADGVELQSSHCLARRIYVSVGPNYLWHIDGYDKIKPHGFAIHGGWDEFSRKILWLRVASSDNIPKAIASYYMDCIRHLRLVPRAIRSDRGIENTITCGIHRFLHRNDEDLMSTKNSFGYGSSTRNKRIECWWSILRRRKLNWWINFFQRHVCGEYCRYQLNMPCRVSVGFFLRNVTRRTRWNTKALE